MVDKHSGNGKGKPRRGIYLLPNLFTTAALFAGFYAITAAINGHFEVAAGSIFLAMVLDGMDGRVARLTNTQSAFGAEYDSLADMLSFGAAPALLVYVWSMSQLGKMGLMAVFVHAAGAALRLARFNTQLGTADKRYFQGLPSPAAAAILAGYVWVGQEYGFAGTTRDLISMVLTVFTGLLMVSNVRYHSFKDIDLKGKIPFVVAIAVMLGYAVVFAHPPLTLFMVFLGYAISGPVFTLIMRRRRKSERKV